MGNLTLTLSEEQKKDLSQKFIEEVSIGEFIVDGKEIRGYMEFTHDGRLYTIIMDRHTDFEECDKIYNHFIGLKI